MTTLDEPQSTLFDISTKDLDPYWVDPNAPLKIPTTPLHFRAHKLQNLLSRLDIQAARNPAQFNSKNYMEILDEFTEAVEAINKGLTVDEVLGPRHMGEIGDESAAGAVGNGISAGLGAGVSADNPLAG